MKRRVPAGRETPRGSREGRGRDAVRPGEIPARGWRDILWRVKAEASEDQIGLVAAGVSFYALLALVPGLAALVSLYGLAADPSDIAEQVHGLGVLPATVRDVVVEQLQRISGTSQTALGTGLVGSLLVALWSASKGMRAMVVALNAVYGEREERGLVHRYALSIAFTSATVLAVVLGLGVVVGIPVVLRLLGLGPLAGAAVAALPWTALLVGVSGLLTLLYRYGPCRRRARWHWVTPGSALATGLWAIASIAFSFYVARLGDYDEAYGAMGTVVVLLMWFWVSTLAALFGAELDAEMEHQTERDSTVGAEKPLGERGAYVADTVGRVP